MLRSFKRGVHLRDSKLSADAKIVQAPVPKRVVIPLLQHIGAPCEPLVKIGDKVKRYQKIADTKAPCSAPIHASISGTVTDISKHPSPNGTNVLSIVIEQSGEDGSAPKKDTKADRLSPEQLLERIREAGIVGMGGAGFPTHIKLKPKTKVDTVVLNGSECEPFLTADHRLMVEHAEEIMKGLELEMKILKVRRAIVAIEENKQEAVEEMRKFANKRIEVIPLKTKYPEGAEKILIKAVLGRECAHTRLPSGVGVVVSNVATAKAIHDAVYYRKPLTERVVTVTGDVSEPKNFMVRIGTPIHDLISICGAGNPDKIISGGPMMGVAQYTDKVPVSKTCNGVLVISKAVDETPLHCIRCGRCVDACPYFLVPTEIARAAEHGRFGLADHLHAKECMECGCCSYVCPSNIPLVQHIRVAKAETLKQEKLKREQ
jgi:electron transport complex protein RnfC